MTAEPRVLVIDDEPQILRVLKPALTAAGYDVVTSGTAKEAQTLAATAAPDIILLDLGLPDMDGKDLLARLRQWSETPVIVLSARDQEREKIAALDLGADDYVEKPFGIGELLARMRAALRHRGQTAAPKELHFGPLRLDAEHRQVTLSGERVKLTPKEYDLLLLLARHGGKVMTHRQLLTAVWGPAHAEDVQYLRVFMGQLRQKIEEDPQTPKLVITEPGIGYRLVTEA